VPVTRVLNRQRILLELASQAGGAFTLRRLTLLAFVVAHETRDRGGESFYSFVPHRNGPVSFTLNHEVGKLADKDLIQLKDEEGTLEPSGRVFLRKGPQQPEDVTQAARLLSGISTEALATRITRRHPQYMRRSAPEVRKGSLVLYTKGYEGQSVEHFLRDLLEAGIRSIIDVRRVPVSRRFGFHKSTLRRLAEEVGLSYHHFPAVGIPSSERKNVKTKADYDALLGWYESSILPRESRVVDSIAELALQEPSVLVCSERDARLCHRSRLAAAVSSTNGLKVLHA